MNEQTSGSDYCEFMQELVDIFEPIEENITSYRMNEQTSGSDYCEFMQELVDIFEPIEENITSYRTNESVLTIFNLVCLVQNHVNN